jgi:diguanylate cyclase (GGDEF)-like protein
MMENSSADRELTVLIANDHEWAARSVESILSAEGYRVVRAYTGRQALETAMDTQPDAIILDLQMPDLDGLEVCRELRANPLFGPTIPIFVTTAGPSGRAERLEAYRAGAWEFFGQPLDGEAVLLKLKTFLESKAVVDGLRRESLVDETTGLYNRRGLVRRGRELASDAARRGVTLACFVFSPDLPRVADTMAGADRMAGRMSAIFRASGRSSDAIGRLGGLDFGVITIGSDAAEAEKLIRRLSETALRIPADQWSDGSGMSLKSAYCISDHAGQPDADPEQMLDTATDAVHETRPEPSNRVVEA